MLVMLVLDCIYVAYCIYLPKLHMSNILQPFKAYYGTSCGTCGLFQRSRVQKNGNPKKRSHSISPREPQHTPGIPNSPKRRELQIINCLLGGVCWGSFWYVPGFFVGKLLGDDIQPPHPKSYDHLKERLPKCHNYTVQAGADCELFGCLLEYHPPQLQRHLVDIPG